MYCQQRRHLARSPGPIAIEVEDGSARIPFHRVSWRVRTEADARSHPPSNLTSYFHANSAVEVGSDSSVNLTSETMSNFGNRAAIRPTGSKT